MWEYKEGEGVQGMCVFVYKLTREEEEEEVRPYLESNLKRFSLLLFNFSPCLSKKLNELHCR